MSGGANYTRNKTWASTEDITPADLNAEFDNVLNNSDPGGLGDDSVNVAEMRQQVSPGTYGSESLATNLAGELRRLRYVLARLIGGTNGVWYDVPAISLSDVNAILSEGNAIPDTRIVSGRLRSTVSGLPAHLLAHASLPTITLKAGGANPNFVAFIDGTQVTLSADVTKASLSLAPSVNNTCLVNDTALSGAEATKTQGENGTVITIDNVGSEISALVGKFAAFKTSTEYFIAYVSSATELSKAYRGFFFDTADAPFSRVAISNNDTITLMKLTWVFFKNTGVLSVTYNNPVWAFDQPTSPASGDYWYDLGNQTWKMFDGASFVSADALLVGMCIQDTSKTVATRSFEAFAAYSSLNTITVETESNDTVRSNMPGASLSVAGITYKWADSLIYWNMPDDLDTGTEQASKVYHLYITYTGDKLMSLTAPHNRMADLYGFYHPHNLWRWVGSVSNDGSSHFVGNSVYTQTTDGTNPGFGGVASKTVSTSATYSSTSFTDTELVASLYCTGKKVAFSVTGYNVGSDTGTGGGYFWLNGAGTFLYWKILRDSTLIGSGEAGHMSFVPSTVVSMVDTEATPGLHTYKLQIAVIGGGSIVFYDTKLCVYEIA